MSLIYLIWHYLRWCVCFLNRLSFLCAKRPQRKPRRGPQREPTPMCSPCLSRLRSRSLKRWELLSPFLFCWCAAWQSTTPGLCKWCMNVHAHSIMENITAQRVVGSSFLSILCLSISIVLHRSMSTCLFSCLQLGSSEACGMLEWEWTLPRHPACVISD